jgi:hypothetical protein
MTMPYGQTRTRVFIICLAMPNGRGIITDGLRRLGAAIGLAMDVLGLGASRILAAALLWWSTASTRHRQGSALATATALVLIYAIPALRPLTLVAAITAITAIATTGISCHRHRTGTPETQPGPAGFPRADRDAR